MVASWGTSGDNNWDGEDANRGETDASPAHSRKWIQRQKCCRSHWRPWMWCQELIWSHPGQLSAFDADSCSPALIFGDFGEKRTKKNLRVSDLWWGFHPISTRLAYNAGGIRWRWSASAHVGRDLLNPIFAEDWQMVIYVHLLHDCSQILSDWFCSQTCSTRTVPLWASSSPSKESP